ncbi:J domain-containing protein [Desulfosarcina sp.]|uniref:J domain-containing protein n=1 Tax=Desulfosarcina sp. TaxID=2027861 RepID=UPI0039708E75
MRTRVIGPVLTAPARGRCNPRCIAMARDYYMVLGIAREASPEQIKEAFRRGAKRLHPDAGIGTGSGSDGFRELNDAYQTLSDTEKRKAYDAVLAPQPPLHAVQRRGMEKRDFGACPVVPLNTSPPCDSFQSLDLQLQIPSALARRGGEVILELPLTDVCPACGGAVFSAPGCPLCQGCGRVETRISVPLRIGPNTVHGERRTLLLRRERLVLNLALVCL